MAEDTNHAAPVAAERRPYQVAVVEAARRHYAAGCRRLLIQGETGSGKTEVAIAIAEGVVARGRTALFLADNRVLVTNLSDRFARRGLPHGVLMAGYQPDRSHPVQVASKQTFLSRFFATDGQPRGDLPPADTVFIDEAHRAPSFGYRKLVAAYPKAFVLGLTATPSRSDGKGMGESFDALTCMVPPSQLIAEGYLVPTVVFAPYRPDLKGVRTVDGDYHQGQLAKRMDQPRLVGDLVAHWKRLAQGRPTMVCASGIQHSLHVRDQFRRAGISCEHVDGDTDDDRREEIYGRIKDGFLTAFSVYGVGIEGLDLPCLSVLVMARPTKSFIVWRQACGRIKRPFPGKGSCLLIDHAGCVHAHGHPDEDVEWSLDARDKAHALTRDRKPKTPGEEGPRQDVTCPECFAFHRAAPVCPNCGHVYERKRRAADAEHADGQLVRVDDAVAVAVSRETKVRAWHAALGMCFHTGRSYKAASAIFYKKFAHWPDAVEGMPNLVGPGDRHRPVRDLFPSYYRRKAL